MNAHINYDLPQALLAVITDEEFDDPELVARREADHKAIDDILASRVSAEGDELISIDGPGSLLDRLLKPFNQSGTRRFLREARQKVWANAISLSQARRTGAGAYAARLAELEELSAAKVTELQAPGQVLLKLAVNGFGVRLPDHPAGRGEQFAIGPLELVLALRALGARRPRNIEHARFHAAPAVAQFRPDLARDLADLLHRPRQHPHPIPQQA